MKLRYLKKLVDPTEQDNSIHKITVISEDRQFYLFLEQEIDTSSQKEQLEKELKHFEGFLLSVDKKLSNEKFVQNAKPEVVELERRKKADAEEKIKMVKEALAVIG